MRAYIQYYQDSNHPALASDGLVLVDGRLSLANMIAIAESENHQDYTLYEIRVVAGRRLYQRVRVLHRNFKMGDRYES